MTAGSKRSLFWASSMSCLLCACTLSFELPGADAGQLDSGLLEAGRADAGSDGGGARCDEGCFDGVSCQSGRQPVACGQAGTMCQVCAADEACGEGACRYRAFADQLALGDKHTCIRSAGTVYCWGKNRQGQVGTAGTYTTAGPGVLPETGFVDIDLGLNHSCGVKADGTLWCWGDDLEGALGNGPDDGRTNVPDQIGEDRRWVAVTAGGLSGCAIDEAGALFCWGENGQGQLGIGGTPPKTSTPFRAGTREDWARVELGGRYACGLTEAGELFCWGDNRRGQLGTGDGQARTSPAPVGTSYDEIATGSAHACALRAGRLLCWGDNSRGQLGLGPDAGETVGVPRRVGDRADWSWVGTGSFHTCAIRNGALYCFGANGRGQLGLGDAATGTDADVPTPVVTPEITWTMVDGGLEHTCAVDAAGRTYCWGSSDQRQLVHDATSSPREVPLPLGE